MNSAFCVSPRGTTHKIMTTKEIKSFKCSDEYYDMCNTANLCSDNDDGWDKIYIVEGERLKLKNQCDAISRQADNDYDNGDDTNCMRYMSAVDNAMDTYGVEENSAEYYRLILASYKSLS